MRKIIDLKRESALVDALSAMHDQAAALEEPLAKIVAALRDFEAHDDVEVFDTFLAYARDLKQESLSMAKAIENRE